MLATKLALMMLMSVGWMIVNGKASTAPKLLTDALVVSLLGYSFAHHDVRAAAMADLHITSQNHCSTSW